MTEVTTEAGPIQFPPLYKRTSTGATQVWYQELEGRCYRTITGQLNGEKTVTGWVVAEGTNIGRSNERTPEQQAVFEVKANYTKKLEQGGYHESIEDIDHQKFFKPMLAHKFEEWAGDCYSQPKLDGMRCIATAEGLFSRNGKPIVSVPHIVEALAPLFEEDPDLIFDGELYNHDLRDDFNRIMSLVKKSKPCEEARDVVQYHIYDVASSDRAFSDRLHYLRRLTSLQHPAIRIVETWLVQKSESLDRLFSEYLSAGYEGQMVRIDAPYEQKRSKNLLKRKEFQDGEFTLIGLEEGLGNWAGYAKRAIFRLKDGREFGAGIRGSQDFCKALLAERQSHIGKPATIRFFNYTPDGIPRFPVVTEFSRVD